MKRLTNKTQYGYESGEDGMISLCSDKLGALEDIEQELGIDLITLFKALKQKDIYFYDESDSISFIEKTPIASDELYFGDLDIDKKYFYASGETGHIKCSFEDYGKTWALTKEELDNGK